ncbi:hypothetical protein C8J56DRAFT_784641, partial [Mycena floridula]
TNTITAQVQHARSQNSMKVQLGMGIFAYASGASRRLIEVMARSHLSVSYTTILSSLSLIAEASINRATMVVATKPHAYAYDNINISQTQHVEQHPGAPSKVQSGTFPVIYELANANMDDMLLQPMLDNLVVAPDLTATDISPSMDQLRSYQHQAKIHTIRALLTHHKSFANYPNSPLLQHKVRRQLPVGHRTQFHPLRITTLEEATVKGNLQVQEDTYITQLKQPKHQGGDLNAWEKHQIFQLGMGLFHFIMNLMWAIRKKYYGTLSQIGSLSYYFTLLDKVRLGGEKTHYHGLLSTFKQLLDGILLHAWLLECSHPSLNAFAKSKPSPAVLLTIAGQILRKHATTAESHISEQDTAHSNLRLLTRELMYVIELTRAVADGDFGRVEDLFPDIARVFRGAGSNSYSTEILHYLHNVKHVWTPQFA